MNEIVGENFEKMGKEALLAWVNGRIEEGRLAMMMFFEAAEGIQCYERKFGRFPISSPIIGKLRNLNTKCIDSEFFEATFVAGSLFDAGKHLPKAAQRKIASNEPIEVAVLKPNGEIDRTMLAPTALGRKMINLVFAKDHVRSYEEQVPILREAAMVGAIKGESVKGVKIFKNGPVKFVRIELSTSPHTIITLSQMQQWIKEMGE